MKNSSLRVGTAAVLVSTAMASALAMIGLNANAAQQPFVPPSFFPLPMSINQLMVGVVDDAAHGIWAAGNKAAPLSNDEWVEVRMNTYQLQAAATLVSLGGTGPADRGWVTSPAFQQHVRTLNNQAVTARTAVDAKNQTALRTAGDNLVDVCNGCHQEFKPDVPTEGILLQRGHDY